MPPVIRYAASGPTPQRLHAPVARRPAPTPGARNSPSRSARMDLLPVSVSAPSTAPLRNRRSRVRPGWPGCRRARPTAVAARPAMTRGESPQAALAQRRAGDGLADATGDDPQRDRVVFVALGQLADEIGHFRRQPDRTVDVGVRAGPARRGRDISCLGNRRPGCSRRPRADSAVRWTMLSPPTTASVPGFGAPARHGPQARVATRSHARTIADRRRGRELARGWTPYPRTAASGCRRMYCRRVP